MHPMLLAQARVIYHRPTDCEYSVLSMLISQHQGMVLGEKIRKNCFYMRR